MRRAGEREDAGGEGRGQADRVPRMLGLAGDGEKVKAWMDHGEPALTVLHERMEKGQAVVRDDRENGTEQAGGGPRWV